MQLLTPLLVIFTLLAAQSRASGYKPNNPAFDEFRHVSNLRVSLRTVERPQQCLLFWKGLSEKLEEETSYRRPDSGVADQELLRSLAQRLKAKTVYRKLAIFVEECEQVLGRLPREAFAQFARKGSRAFDDDLVDVVALKRRLAQREQQLVQAECERDAALEKIRVIMEENPGLAMQSRLNVTRCSLND